MSSTVLLASPQFIAHGILIECYDGIGHAPLPNMIESRQFNHTEGRGCAFWCLGYDAVKVHKGLYVAPA